jgi:hypothetical protein
LPPEYQPSLKTQTTPLGIEMIRSDVRDDPDRRASDFTEVGGLTDIVDSHFNDGTLMPSIETEECLWNPQAVVQIALGLENVPPMRHHACRHFFRRGLPVASRNDHDRDLELASMVRSQSLVRRQGIAHTENNRHLPPQTSL